MKLTSLSFILTCLLLVSCASRKFGWDKSGGEINLTTQEFQKIKAEALASWKARIETTKLVEALKKFEQLHAAQPEDKEILNFLARGYYFLADSHYEEVELKKKTYELAASFGEKGMATNAQFKSDIQAGKTVEEALKHLSKIDVPAIYWTAASLGKWAKASGIAAALKYKTRIKAMIERVEGLDPDYFFAAPSRYWGGFYAVAPSFAGGDMDKSKVKFEKSIKHSPEYLGTKVLMAEVYFAKKGMKKEFLNSLNEVLVSKFDEHAEIGPENAWEKKKAKKLLDKVDELF